MSDNSDKTLEIMFLNLREIFPLMLSRCVASVNKAEFADLWEMADERDKGWWNELLSTKASQSHFHTVKDRDLVL